LKKRTIYCSAFHFDSEYANYAFDEDAKKFSELMRETYGAISTTFTLGHNSVGVGKISTSGWLGLCYNDAILALENKKSQDSVIIFYYSGHSGFQKEEYCLTGHDELGRNKSIPFEYVTNYLENLLTQLNFHGSLICARLLLRRECREDFTRIFYSLLMR
jgi:hypothetical protein